jgi:DNA polymerase III subunit delta
MPEPSPAAKAVLALIHGEDDFAVKQRAKEFYAKWTAEIGGMDHEVVDGQAANSSEALKALARLRESLQTLPFFGTGKVIWLKDCNFMGDERAASVQAVTEGLSDLATELKSFSWQSVRLLISAGKVDKRRTFYKAIEKLGTVQQFDAISVDDKDWATTAEGWALKALRDQKKQITDDALAELVNSVGPSHRQLESEIEKLCLYVGERPQIEVKDVQRIVTRNKHARAFALGDALGLPQAQRYSSEELVLAMGVLLDCNQRLIFSNLDAALVLQQALVQIVSRNSGSSKNLDT